jgi:hypothetical protein
LQIQKTYFSLQRQIRKAFLAKKSKNLAQKFPGIFGGLQK